MNTQYMKLMIVSYFLLFFLHFLKVRRRFLFIKDDRSIHLLANEVCKNMLFGQIMDFLMG